MAKEMVGRASEIPPGSMKVVTARGREIVVFNINGEFFAFLNRCPHEGAKLCFGAVVGLTESDNPGSYRFSRKGEFLRCPWHGWEFDIRTGQSWSDPQRTRMRNFPVTLEKVEEDGRQPGPYVVETFPTLREDQYVFVQV
jgi:nitrite reductase/ring-hydroxylating ferredoxin subunit